MEKREPELSEPVVPSSISRHTLAGVYNLWRWSAGDARWSLVKEGPEPGAAPDQPGQFEGQIVRWPGGSQGRA